MVDKRVFCAPARGDGGAGRSPGWTQPGYISLISARLLLTKPLEETHQRTDSSVMGAENQSTR